jgi:hypothetical protein
VKNTVELVIGPTGVVRTIYSEVLDLRSLGSTKIVRVSHVEPDDDGQWQADLTLVDGPILRPYYERSQALEAEVAWLRDNWL